MEISQLRTILHVAELGSLSKAADRLNIAQPALSRQVRLLEEELGVTLFTRHGRGMVVTDQGREVLKRGARAMAEIEEIRTSASDSDAALTGQIAIGMPPIGPCRALPASRLMPSSTLSIAMSNRGAGLASS